MRRVIAILALCFLGAGCVRDTALTTLHIGSAQVAVEIADSPALRERGLSYRLALPEDQGMLFIFKSYETPGFWMKEMHFPLDLIWIANGKVVEITSNVPVATTTPLIIYTPSQPITSVLEVNAGWAERNHITLDDPVSYQQ